MVTGYDTNLSVRDNFWFSFPVAKKMLRQVTEVRESRPRGSTLREVMLSAFCSVWVSSSGVRYPAGVKNTGLITRKDLDWRQGSGGYCCRDCGSPWVGSEKSMANAQPGTWPRAGLICLWKGGINDGWMNPRQSPKNHLEWEKKEKSVSERERERNRLCCYELSKFHSLPQ